MLLDDIMRTQKRKTRQIYLLKVNAIPNSVKFKSLDCLAATLKDAINHNFFQ